MNWRTECAAVIPCLNEEHGIAMLVHEVRHFLPTVFVVDDGSTDATRKEALGAGAEVLSHPKACGKGAALGTGWTRARGAGFRWALCLDGDGQHSPRHMPEFFRCAERSGAELVIGNRMGQAGRMPLIRRVTNRWMSRRLSRLARQEFPDSQCGYRLMNLQQWSRLRLTTSHFEVESEVLIGFANLGSLVEFVPVDVIYRNERSKIRLMADTLRWLRWWIAAYRRSRHGKSVTRGYGEASPARLSS